VLLTHPEKLGLADGHGNVPPDPSAGGQHWSPAHMLLDPGHCTLAPRAQVFAVVVVVVVVVVVARQSSTFVLLTHPEKLGLADGHGNVPPDPSAGGQHWSPAHMLLDPGHRTLAPGAQTPSTPLACCATLLCRRAAPSSSPGWHTPPLQVSARSPASAAARASEGRRSAAIWDIMAAGGGAGWTEGL